MRRKVSPSTIGAFVVVGIMLIVAGVILFGSGRMFDRKREFVSFFPGSVAGLNVGSNVSLRGVPVGTVKEILLAMGPEEDLVGEDMRIPVVFEVDETTIQERGSALNLEDPEQFQRLIERGLSARLDTESLLTGRLYVSLDFRPDQSPVTYGATHRLAEIPTVPSPMADIGAKFQEFSNRVLSIDFEATAGTIREALDGVSALINSSDTQALPGEVVRLMEGLDSAVASFRDLALTADSTVGPMGESLSATAEQAQASMAVVETTLGSMQSMLDPNAPMAVSLVRTLEELELAARALRRVVELLERDPAVLLRGRDTGGGS